MFVFIQHIDFRFPSNVFEENEQAEQEQALISRFEFAELSRFEIYPF